MTLRTHAKLVPMDVTRELLADHSIPPLAAAHVEVRRITMAPGVLAGPHRHNGPVFGTIESGSVYFAIGDGVETVLRAGDTFYEPAGVVIRRFDATDEGVVFLAWFPLESGVAGEMTRE